MMGNIRIGYRLAQLSLVVLAGSILTLLFQRGTLPPDGLQSRITRWWHRAIAHSLGMRIRIHGIPRERATLFVSNHLSSFDIPALGSILPTRFLSKIELRHWPLMGWLATRAGTLFIERGASEATAATNRNMAEVLSQDQNIVLFPEGTVSDGNMKKFHSRLIQSAVDSGAWIQPVAIRYPDPDGGLINPAAMVIEAMSFKEFSRRVLAAKQLDVEIYFGEAVSAQDKSRDELARYAQAEVRELLG